MHTFAVEAINRHAPRPKQAHRVVGDRVEDRLDICLRAADYAQDLGCRCLPVKRLREVAIAYLQLLEKQDIVDGDYGLVGERLHQRDLLGRERAYLEPLDIDDANHDSLAHERDDQHGAEAAALLKRPRLKILTPGELLEDVLDVNDLAFDDGAARRRIA